MAFTEPWNSNEWNPVRLDEGSSSEGKVVKSSQTVRSSDLLLFQFYLFLVAEVGGLAGRSNGGSDGS